MQQLAEIDSSRGDLTRYLSTLHDDLADLWRRAEVAAQADKATA
jgi:hypothetical protein